VAFGWSFYGFFVAAVVWMVLYFVGIRAIEARERRRSRR